MNTLKKIQQIADAMNAGVEPSDDVFLYKLGTASDNPNRNQEHQVFTKTETPRLIGSIGKVGGEGSFRPFEHLDGNSLVCSL